MSQRGVAQFSRARGAPAGFPPVLLLVYCLLFLNTAQFIAMIALAPTYSDALDLSKFQTSLILAVSGAGSAAGSLPAALWCNRFGVRPVALAGVAIVAGTLWLQAFPPSFGLLLVARFVIGVGFCFVLSAAPAWVAEAAPPEHRAAATSATMLVAGFGLLIGPTLAGTLSDAAGKATPMIVLSIALAANGVALALAPRHPFQPHGSEPLLRTFGRVRGSLLAIAGIALFGVGVFGENVAGTLVPLRLDHNGLSASAIGGILSAGAGLWVIVSGLMTRYSRRVTTMPFAIVATLGLAGSMALLASSHSTGVAATGIVLRTALLAAMYCVAYPFAGMGAVRAGVGPGAIFALMQLGAGSVNAIGPLVAGKIGESLGDAWAYGLSSGAAVAVAGLLWRAYRRDPDATAHEPAPAAGAAHEPAPAGSAAHGPAHAPGAAAASRVAPPDAAPESA